MRVRRILLAGVVLAAVLLGGGVAWGYWTTSGTGVGEASVTDTAPAVGLHATVAGNLLPGTAVAVQLSADNPSATELRIGIVSLESITADRVGCDVNDFRMPDVAVDQVVPPHRNAFPLASTGLLRYANTAADQSGCSGARLTLTISSR